MTTGKKTLCYTYLRLSVEEEKDEKRGKSSNDESSSIKNQRTVIERYCKMNGLTIIREFKDDGWSGGNFDRPGFNAMMQELEKEKVFTVITKDLSRLGRDMRESSYYAEQFFPEHGIHYIAINDNFDSEKDNVLAPFQFAMNEVYLRDGSRKIKEVLKVKRESGQYCACPPYGYKKSRENEHMLVPDEETAPIVRRIFEQAAAGDSSRKIAHDLIEDGVIPPLKYRVLYRDKFSEKGAARASDLWNYTTVKRILKNEVYLGDTLLGKSRKASVKSKKKVSLPKEEWAITEDTHEPLISEKTFEIAQINLGRGTKNYQKYDRVRKSIFSGIAVCSRCGYSLCSCGTVYKGERDKYWYLSCTHHRSDIENTCDGVRVRYSDLMEVVRNDLNSLIDLSDEEAKVITEEALKRAFSEEVIRDRKKKLKQSEDRLAAIDKIITKLYFDNAEGRLDDGRLATMVDQLQQEAKGLQVAVAELSTEDGADIAKDNFNRFFKMAKQYSHINALDRATLTAFVDRIVVGPKVLPPGVKNAARVKAPFTQSIQIFYKFIGDISVNSDRHLGIGDGKVV